MTVAVEYCKSLVSILSQPEGRELQVLQMKKMLQMKFQSSPSPKAGSYLSTTLTYP